jgi:hypothetical protein
MEEKDFFREINIRGLKGHIELISTIGSLHTTPFLLRTSLFSTGRTGRIAYRKKPLNSNGA